MSEFLREQYVTLEDNREVTIRYFMLEETGVQRPYGIRAEMRFKGEKIDEAEAPSRFATREEAMAISGVLADSAVTPITLNDII